MIEPFTVGRKVSPSGDARKLSGFGMKLLAYDPWGSEERAKELNVTLTDMDTIYAEADFISLALPNFPSSAPRK